MRWLLILLVSLSGCVAESKVMVRTTPKTAYDVGVEIVVK